MLLAVLIEANSEVKRKIKYLLGLTIERTRSSRGYVIRRNGKKKKTPS